jgi:hypothetical protein
MQTSEIMVINKLGTGTAFGVTLDSDENVFLPAKIMCMVNAQIGEKLQAILVPNTFLPERTPWMAIRIDRLKDAPPVVFVADIYSKIIDDLRENGRACVAEIADNLECEEIVVADKLQDLVRRGQIRQRMYYAINEGDFDDGDAE